MNTRLIAECTDEVLLTVCTIAGSQFCPAGTKDILKSLDLGQQLCLTRETDNAHDPCAVRVDTPASWKLGYIPGKSCNNENRLISHLLDKGCELMCLVRAKGDPDGHIAQLITIGVYIRL